MQVRLADAVATGRDALRDALPRDPGPYQVRTNAIAPTAVRTDFSRVLWETPDALARATARVPMGRIGEADDVAGLALLLASPAGSFINGQVIGVDGGASAW